MGSAAIFSFFPAKNLGALGDAGAVVTDDEELYSRLKALRSHGAVKKYHHTLVGGNFRIDTLQAAMLNIKLKYLGRWTKQRRRVAAFYDRAFKSSGFITIPDPGDNFHVYNQYVIRVAEDKRDITAAALKKAEIGHAIYYPAPLHLQPCFAGLGYKKGSMPNAERACLQNLALPVDPDLSDIELEQVAARVMEVFKNDEQK
jgi:dTDP-4-amino-4,6-dideoxygalactose transaminase